MSLKKMLGMMMVSRMAGRGKRSGGGLGAGLGGAAAMGAFGKGIGRKAGIASLAYMAYRAYQDNQSRSGSASASGGSGFGSTGFGATGGGSTGGGSAGGSLGGRIGGMVDNLLGGGASPAPSSAASPVDQIEDDIGEDTALLLIRAMVAAANADGTITPDERERILGQMDEAGADAEDHAQLEHELANPQPLRSLLALVPDHETAQQFYMASRAAIDPSTEANRIYLETLRVKLDMTAAEVAEVEELTA